VSSLADDGDLLLAVLAAHPRRAMTSTELRAKTRQLDAEHATRAIATLADQGAIVVQNATLPDPHFPSISAIALVEESLEGSAALTDARRRAQDCVSVLHRQLLRSHRCM